VNELPIKGNAPFRERKPESVIYKKKAARLKLSNRSENARLPVMPVHDGKVEGAVPELLDGRHVIRNRIIDRPVRFVRRMIERNVAVDDVADPAALELFLDDLEPGGVMLDACQSSETLREPGRAPAASPFKARHLPGEGGLAEPNRPLRDYRLVG
jgi:hypothetical protein